MGYDIPSKISKQFHEAFKDTLDALGNGQGKNWKFVIEKIGRLSTDPKLLSITLVVIDKKAVAYQILTPVNSLNYIVQKGVGIIDRAQFQECKNDLHDLAMLVLGKVRYNQIAPHGVANLNTIYWSGRTLVIPLLREDEIIFKQDLWKKITESTGLVEYQNEMPQI